MSSTSPDDPAGLIIGPRADQLLSSCSPEEKFALRIILFGLLLDPGPDGINKFEADYFPYTGQGVVEFVDATWYVAYTVEGDRSVYVLTIRRRAHLQPPR